MHRIRSVVCGFLSLTSRSSKSITYLPLSYTSWLCNTFLPLLRILLKKMLYTGVMITTFSAGVVSFLTELDIAGITPVTNISQSSSILKLWRLSHQPVYASYQPFGTSEYPYIPRSAFALIASVISGAVLKSMSATHIGSSLSATSHFSESVPRRFTTVSKSYFIISFLPDNTP